jgi:hypothetical protein
MPVAQNGNYDVPVMARRDLHGEYRPYGSSKFSLVNSVFSSPSKLISNVRSQLSHGYSAIRDRLTHNNQQQSTSQLFNSSFGGTRDHRSSSQSSTSGQTRNYNLRQRAPVHSTPRDSTDSEQRKTTSKQQKDRKSQDDHEDIEEHGHYDKEEKSDEHKSNIIVRFIKRILHLPFDILSFIWHKFFGLPWWLLIPLLLFLGFYACKYFSFSFLFIYSLYF